MIRNAKALAPLVASVGAAVAAAAISASHVHNDRQRLRTA